MNLNTHKFLAAVASVAVTAAILASQAFLVHNASEAWNAGSVGFHEAATPHIQQATAEHLKTRG